MNKWFVYEYIKKYYMDHGTLPNWGKIVNRFPNMSYKEIREGMAEFKTVIKWGA